MKHNVVIYVKNGCPYCIRAKNLLDEKGVQYEEIDVTKEPELFNEIKSQYNVRTVPQIFVVDDYGNYIHHISGSDKLIDLNNKGELDSILGSTNNNVIGNSSEIDLGYKSDMELDEYQYTSEDFVNPW